MTGVPAGRWRSKSMDVGTHPDRQWAYDGSFRVGNPHRIDLAQWTALRTEGPPPEDRWLVEGVFPLAAPVMMAGMGGVGKSFLTMELALAVALGDLPGARVKRTFGGGRVTTHGTVVFLTAEDDLAEVHKRLHALDPDGDRLRRPDRLRVVPLLSAGGSMTVVNGSHAGLNTSPVFDDLFSQLKSIDDLALFILDPLQAFVSSDLNSSPHVGQYVGALMGTVATETDATVMLLHHMRKAQKPITSPFEAREAVRGTTALVDSMRTVYALWPSQEKTARGICRNLGVEHDPERVVYGAVAKTNKKSKRWVRTLVRSDSGVLEDRTDALSGTRAAARADLLEALLRSIQAAAAENRPFTKTGSSGLYRRRLELSEPLQSVPKHVLEEMAQELIDGHVVERYPGVGTQRPTWLDIPGGGFAKRVAESD